MTDARPAGCSAQVFSLKYCGQSGNAERRRTEHLDNFVNGKDLQSTPANARFFHVVRT